MCIIFAAFLVIVPLLAAPHFGHLVATLSIVSGLVFYIPLVHFKKVPPGLGKDVSIVTRHGDRGDKNFSYNF